MIQQFKDKVALVTGASRGIGQEIAQVLASRGAYVIGTATSDAGANAITMNFEKNGWQGHGMRLEVTDLNSLEALMSTLEETKKLPHILVNNAGITADNLLLRMDEEEWDKVIATNLTGVYRLTKACIKSMFRARYGRIITIGSVVGLSGNSGQSNYTAAKAGIIGFSKSLAQEMGSRGITVNIVAPGFIDTDMTTNLPDVVKDEMLKRIPLRRMGTAIEVAEAVAFLASDAAAYITGETLNVNGGLYMN